MTTKITARDLLLLLVLTAAGVLLHGYHLGHQDGAIYLPAIKKNLNPAVYPYASAFFLSQARWMLFGELVAFSVRLTRVQLDLAVFLWHLLAIFVVLLASLQLSRRIFAAPAAQWGAVLTVWAARLLPVAGTQLQLMDRYLHPRDRSEEHTSELQSRLHLVCRLLLEKKKHASPDSRYPPQQP